jgi:hypothetical protein
MRTTWLQPSRGNGVRLAGPAKWGRISSCEPVSQPALLKLTSTASAARLISNGDKPVDARSALWAVSEFERLGPAKAGGSVWDRVARAIQHAPQLCSV